jgi:hypothetical protein
MLSRMAMRSQPPRSRNVVALAAGRPLHPRTARILDLRDGAPVVDFEGAIGPTVARVEASVTPERLADALANGHEALVVLDGGDATRPIVVGLLAPPARQPARVVEADVDGQRVRIEGKDEIVLQCGAASITLRRNGRVVIRGTYVETYATGTNRIRGGNVLVN